MLGLSPDIIGNPWQKDWNSSHKPKQPAHHSHHVKLHRPKLDLSKDLDLSRFKKRLYVSTRTIICGSKVISRPLLKALRFVNTIILEDLPAHFPKILNTRGIKIHLKDQSELAIKASLVKLFKANKKLDNVSITYERPDIKNKVPIATFVLVRNLKKFSLDGQGEYLSAIGEQFFKFKNHIKIEEINISNKNFYFKHSFNRPQSLQKLIDTLPTF